MYYKDLNSFGKCNIIDENLIVDRLDFSILNTNEEIDYSRPNLYNSCQTPITLEFVNKDIKTNAIITNNNEPLTFDGTLLKKANITLNSIYTTLSFNINIINNLDEKFICNINIEIPLEDTRSNESILNGNIKKEISNLTNYKFYKTKEIYK